LIPEKFVDLYSRNSGLRDKLIAERDVVLTYSLHALYDAGIMASLAFKGGTCLRKLVFGSSGRFSEDLDFTIATEGDEDSILVRIIEVFNQKHHGVEYSVENYYQTDDETSFGGDILYRHDWNDSGRFRLQVSLREQPTLPVTPRAFLEHSYFKHVEFDQFLVPSLEPIEMISEKVRAAYQRAKVRDLYDLYCFSNTPFDGELLRKLVVLKLWQVQDPFDPQLFFAKLSSAYYDWDDIQRLVRASEKIESAEILDNIRKRFSILRQLTDLEQRVISDSSGGWNQPLANQLCKEILVCFEKSA